MSNVLVKLAVGVGVSVATVMVGKAVRSINEAILNKQKEEIDRILKQERATNKL